MILTALNDYYHRLQEKDPDSIPAFGFSRENISYAIILSEEGELVDIRDIRDASVKKSAPRLISVPKIKGRSGQKAPPFFTWDNGKYTLGLISTDDLDKEEKAKNAAKEKAADRHQAFKELHQQLLSFGEHPVIDAFLNFLDNWRPDQFDTLPFANDEIRDSNIIFKIDGVRQYLHEVDEVKQAWEKFCLPTKGHTSRCLITGEKLPVSRVHPPIKKTGWSSFGVRIVSFKQESFQSYGKSQGANSPISEQAAFAYTTVLNQLLQKGSRQCLHLGDTSMVFWAQADDAKQAEAAEDVFAAFLNNSPDDESETKKLQQKLTDLSKGRPIDDWSPDVDGSTQVYVLGLAPNASRLSIRYWETGTLQRFAERLAQHYQDMTMKPLPWKKPPSAYQLLLQTVPHREGSKPKIDDVSPHLGGELLRAILTGGRYPQSLLTNLIMRMRSDGDISPFRVALCKAVITRNQRLNNTQHKEIPMSLDKTNTDSGYLLGRLFATLEYAQRGALGKDVNATIRDRYYGSASATPGSVFPVLIRNGQNHLSKLRKKRPGQAVNIEKNIVEIIDKLGNDFPKSLRIESQGRFAIGYYHQNKDHFTSKNQENNEQGEDA